ncbi:Uncharacterised protein [Mycobacteroides abscessus subsp. abscessus]|nr:Uncharacterised protein [Mycobacteroides abscessus subsp. abscessus]
MSPQTSANSPSGAISRGLAQSTISGLPRSLRSLIDRKDGRTSNPPNR